MFSCTGSPCTGCLLLVLLTSHLLHAAPQISSPGVVAPGNTTTTPPSKIPVLVTPKPPQPLVLAHLQQTEQPKACDQFIESTSNEFHSPNYPGDYIDSLDCIKIISAGEGEVIRLRFVEHFHLEQDDQCRYDFLEVRDGQFGYSTLIGKLCGTVPPTVLESSGRHLWLRFHSDQDIHYIGFRAFYEFVPSSSRPDLDDCSFHLPSLEANITSEDLSEEILSNRKDLSIQYLDCTWVLEAPKNQRIYMQFKAFNLERANDCTFNFVEVYGSKTELYSKEGRLHQFCGSDTKPIFSKSNVLHLRFFTALSIEPTELGIGFKTKLHVYYSHYRDLSDFKSTTPGEPNELEKCVEGDEFDCTDNTCIDLKLICNLQANCKQGNDEDKAKCRSNKAAFQMTMDLIVIAFIGCFLAAGMCSGLILNICRKLRQDKIELEEIRANMHKSRDSMGNTSAKSNKPPKSTTNSEHDLKSISINEAGKQNAPNNQTTTIEDGTPKLTKTHMSDNSSSAESKDTVIYRPYYKEHHNSPIPPPQQIQQQQPPSSDQTHPNQFGFTFKPMRPSPQPVPPPLSVTPRSSSIPYSPPPPYNPAASLLNKFTQPKISKKHVHVYDAPPPAQPEVDPPAQEPEEVIHVIEVRDSACQTRESFTERYLKDVYFGGPRHYKQTRSSPSFSASPSPLHPLQHQLQQQQQSKRAPLARGEAVEMLDVPRKHVRKIPKGPADVLMYPRSPGSIASVDASTGSLELLSELDELHEEEQQSKTKKGPSKKEDKRKEEEEDDDDEEDEEDDDDDEDDGIEDLVVPEKSVKRRVGYSEL